MYIADLHIHSRYSRATSKDCTPEHLDLWARKKGIQLLGTGDFTHPAWRQELEEKLEPAEEGLYVLKKEYRIEDGSVGTSMCPRFVLSGEISSIYKKNERVRKVHNVILLPGLEEAEILSRKLETIGNIHSDGRPILGLDSRDLLEITLELCPRAIFIPAHIWTPHFSLFGAFSGFDSIEECFEDLTPHIHALETGLSSDPVMNWQVSALDRFQLISNSDAHSPAKLGREANLLDAELSYSGLYEAVQTGNGLSGTLEFFPEEGKYHYDGHRKCHLCLSPSEADKYDGRCPVCGRKLTIGVSHRIAQLADREEGYILEGAKPYESLVPLPEVIAASLGCSSASKKVQERYGSMIEKLGPEFEILRTLPIEEIRHAAGHMPAEGIRRLREGKVERIPGYDGEYGTIKLFNQDEIDNLDGQMSLFAGMEIPDVPKQEEIASAVPVCAPDEEEQKDAPNTEIHLNPEQEEAATVPCGVMAVIAGPGTGKTGTLISRIQNLLEVRGVKPSEITAVTFTNKAADELRERLALMEGGRRVANRINIGTFHGICYDLLKKQDISFELADETQTIEIAALTVSEFALKIPAKEVLSRISLMKSGIADAEKTLPEDVYTYYQEKLKEHHVLDFDDLLLETLRILKTEVKNEIRKQHFSFLLVDEYQDISPVQYELIRAWNRGGKELFVIGDPDQSIYGFRGSDAKCFDRLKADYPNGKIIRLRQNYRSAPHILNSALGVIAHNGGEQRDIRPVREGGKEVRVVSASGELSEAIFCSKEINRLIGGIDMLDVQEKSDLRQRGGGKSFGDIAVLYRTHYQARLLEKCLQKEGIPYVVSGRDDFLMEAPVRGTVCFFRYLLHQEEELNRQLSMKLLFQLDENCISDTVFDKMAEKYLPLAAKGKPQKILDAWIEDMDLIKNQAMQKLREMSVFYKSMEEMLTGLAFGTEGDLKRCGGKNYTADAVNLMTLHGSKGLEFPAVILYGVKAGMLPLESTKHPSDPEEERRLFYVGMTRAKEELIITTSLEPSSFLEELPGENVLKEKAGKERKVPEAEQMSLFDFM